jgi:hypothetical protein
VPLDLVPARDDETATVLAYVDGLSRRADVSLIVPGPDRMGRIERFRRGRTGARLARELAPNPRVRVTLVRDHPAPGGPDRGELRALPRANHHVVVLIDDADRAALRAVRYALSLGAEDVVAVHAAVDPDAQESLIDRWMELRVPVALDLVECWDRDVARTVERYVAEIMGPRTEVTVVLPRRDFLRLRQRVLHDRTSRGIARALGRYEHVDVAVVPYFIGATTAGPGGSASEPRPEAAGAHRAR